MDLPKPTCIPSKLVLRCHQMLRTDLVYPANERANSFPHLPPLSKRLGRPSSLITENIITVYREVKYKGHQPLPATTDEQLPPL